MRLTAMSGGGTQVGKERVQELSADGFVKKYLPTIVLLSAIIAIMAAAYAAGN